MAAAPPHHEGESKMKLKRFAATAAIAAALTTSFAYASHSWNNYHWARTTSSFTLQVIDSTVPSWDDERDLTLSQWSQSTKLDLVVTSADDSNRARKQCRAVAGKIRVCNAAYGNNGWLGLASINIDSQGHITRGTAKVNDSYAMDQDDRRHVMCQEVGHLFGLGHTSEDGSSQKTCMDYSSDPQSTGPNQHDYDQLTSIYGHTDSYNSYTIGAGFAPTAADNAMAGQVPMGVRVRKGVFDEMWAAPDGKGGVWIHHITLAPGYEHTELID